MNVRQLYQYLNEIIPPSLSCEWDNDGLMCCPDPDREVRRVLIALDVTGEVADEAVDGDFDVVVSHHPLIFKPIRSLTSDDGVGAKLINFVRAGISVMSFHTRLDALAGGVNDQLAEALGLIDVETFDDGDGIPLGRVGYLPEPMDAGEFSARVKGALAAPGVVLACCGKQVDRVAVVGGEGKSFISAAKRTGADTFVSGRIGYNNMVEAEELGLNLIEAGHFFTEDPICDRLSELICAADGNIETVYMKSCALKLI
ncbi:MAG: Nif3-like dinuclear metal center hexameric protein [Clostridia bacterium]|nr:Nif3-like dinuclear metal center hexameric protein [Clostridia bacterium]